MKLLEYEAKDLLEKAKIVTPSCIILRPGEPFSARPAYPAVIKSQVPVGGRGKAGGIAIVENDEEFHEAIRRIFQLEIKGYQPRALIAEPKLPIAEEHYLSLLINREAASIQLVAHNEGGMEVESQLEFKSWNLELGRESLKKIGQELARLYDAPGDATQLQEIVEKLYDCFVDNDALLLEINPLVKTTDGIYVCADAKMELDDAAAFRHPEWDFEDTPKDVNFVTLDESGEVATIANGAGLAMATVDAVAAYGMQPANFLDVGGGANKESVLKAFQRIMEYPNIRAIVINIFAGITRCDEVARAIIAARQEIADLPPLFIRLAGTNFDAAAELLKTEEIPLQSTLEECLTAAQKEVAA